MSSRRTVLKGIAAGAAAAAGVAMRAAFSRSRPASTGGTVAKLTGPVSGGQHGWPFGAYFGDIGARGYVEEEFFLSGAATAFSPQGALGPDGLWSVQPLGTAPYKTRFLVRRPKDPNAFNGTVIVEWLNVSVGYDVSFADAPGLYDGFAYVAVSAQIIGLTGYASQPLGLIAWDPERYGTLHSPGDAYSFDIFTQAARAVGPHRSLGGLDPMGGLAVRKLIAVGASQSGGRLMAYLNAIQPRENVFDALVPVVCAGAASDFSNEQAHLDPGAPKTAQSARGRIIWTRVRDDLSVPVMALNSQTEALYYYPQRQPNTSKFVSWEVAGASHCGTGQIESICQRIERDGVDGPGLLKPTVHVSDVMWLPTLDAAYRHLHRSIHGGEPPPAQPSIEVTGKPPQYAYDRWGNILGGVRLPELEVPIARYVAPSPEGGLLGQTFPFETEQLKELYPTHELYVERAKAAAYAALKAGVILPYRVEEYIVEARAAHIPPT